MNPSTALARVLVDELVRGGVTEAVLSPGSRSAPLAYAVHRAEQQGRLRLHVRIDERSAAFLALGLAKASRRPVPVVTTSGTATANLHPAVLEAEAAGVPLLLLTADRPPELRGTGANQTVDQVGLYGSAVRLFAEVGAPEERAGQNVYWRGLTCRALAAASGDAGSRPGPVHLNLGLREPLVPDADDRLGDGDWPEPLDGRPDGGPWTRRVPPVLLAPTDDLPARTVVVVGDALPELTAAALDLAQARGWPVVAEPSASAGSGSTVVPAAELVVGEPALTPDRVLVVGRPTLSRVVARLVASAPLDVVGGHGQWADPPRQAVRVLPGVPAPGSAAAPAPAPGLSSASGSAPAPGPAPDSGEGRTGTVDPTWLPAWRAAGAAAAARTRGVLDAQPGLPEPVVAAEVAAAVPDGGLLVVGSSKPVRDLFLTGPRAGTTVLANRGAAGIDGTVSTAVGAALAHQRERGGHAYALLGDLTFLHDANGLVLGPQEPRPDLTVVVVDNDGGAIFGLLEQAGPHLTGAFERVFGTPHGVDLAALCAATRTPHALVATREELRQALAPARGVRVVQVRTNRTAAVALDRAIRSSP